MPITPVHNPALNMLPMAWQLLKETISIMHTISKDTIFFIMKIG